MENIKAIIIDHQSLFSECLGVALQHRSKVAVVNTFTEGLPVLEQDVLAEADIILMDLNLIDIDGLELIPRIRKKSKTVKILVLTGYGKSKFVKESLKNGADGYLLKTENMDVLSTAIQSVMEGSAYIGEGLHITPPPGGREERLTQQPASGTVYEDRFTIREKLTKREIEILTLIAQAKNNKEIASELYISDQTVGVHRKNMMKKLGVHNTVNLVKLALEYQLVQ